jgi:hypothetical protein
MKAKTIWVAETEHNGIIWGHNYNELQNTTTYFYPGSVREISIYERTYNRLVKTDGDGVPYHYLKQRGNQYVAASY